MESQNYIDGFVFPVPRQSLSEYNKVAVAVAEIWKEYGALAYHEYVGDDLHLKGTRSFAELMGTNDDEVIIFGWVAFPSREIRDRANAGVAGDPRMPDLLAPLTQQHRVVFDAARMVYGGFQATVATTT